MESQTAINTLIVSCTVQQFTSMLKEAVREVIAEQPGPDVMLTSIEVRSMLKISHGTLITWRKQGKIPFMRKGLRKIVYSRNKVLEAMKNTAHE
jgi:hypothetical protein